MTTKTTITIRRTTGVEETLDVTAKYAGMNDILFARIRDDNRKAGRGECLRYENIVEIDPDQAARDQAAPAVKFGKSADERRHDDLYNEGGEGYNPHR